MENKQLVLPYRSAKPDEMPQSDRSLIQAAANAAHTAYAPYSRFRVGCAIRLQNGHVIQGSNQENASSPCGTCAERTALFYAGAQYPDVPIRCMAICAFTETGPTPKPVTPCGLCRQALLETQKRQDGHSIRLLMAGSEEVWEITDIGLLLPLQFDALSME